MMKYVAITKCRTSKCSNISFPPTSLKKDPVHSSSQTQKKTTLHFFFTDLHRVQQPWRSSEGGDTHIHRIIPPSDTAFRDKAYVLQQAGDTELAAQSGAKRTAGIFSPDRKTMDTLIVHVGLATNLVYKALGQK